MAEFNDFDVEIQDNIQSSPEHKNGVVGTSVLTIDRTDGENCTAVSIHNPVLGIRKNSFEDVIYVTFDGSDPLTNGETVIIGDSIEVSGLVEVGNVKIVSNNAGTNYEMILVGGE